MEFNKAAQALSPELYQKFKTAIELRKWADGSALTKEQLTTCIQAVIAYEQQHVPEEQRVGYVPPKETPCKTNDEQALKWKE